MIGFFDLIEAVRQRLRLAIIIGASVFAVIAILALVQSRSYTAHSSVLIDLANTDPTDSQKSPDPSVTNAVLGTQVDLLRSSAVLQEAARRLNLLNDPTLGDTPELRRQNAEQMLRRKVEITSDENSNVIRIGYTDHDPKFAAMVANMIVDTYLEMQVELRVTPARTGAKWFNARTKDVRERFESAQKRLSDFQRANGIVGVDRMDVEGDKARSLSVQMVEAQAAAARAHSRSGASNDHDVAGSDIVQNLEREVGLQAGKVAELSKTFGPNHPDMKAADAQLQALRGSLAAARGGQTASLSSASRSASMQVAELQAQLNAQQARMIALSGVQDQLMVLQRDVDAARQTYDMVRQRYNEATLKSEVSQASGRRLDRASPPALPSKPNLAVWMFAALLLGGTAGIGVVAALELSEPHVRTSAGTARMADVEVIVDMTNANWVAPISLRSAKEEMFA